MLQDFAASGMRGEDGGRGPASVHMAKKCIEEVCIVLYYIVTNTDIFRELRPPKKKKREPKRNVLQSRSFELSGENRLFIGGQPASCLFEPFNLEET